MEMSEAELIGTQSGKSALPLIILLILTAGLAYFLFTQRSDSLTDLNSSPVPASISASPAVGVMSEATVSAEGAVKEINLTGNNYRFSQAALTVKKGETVRVSLTSADMPHDFVIDELDVKSALVNKGETATVEFTADQIGTFEYYCSVGNHRALGMVGKLTVTE